MSDSFKNYFESQIDEEVDFGPVMRFSIRRGDKNIEHFVFVEDSTDEQFHGNTQIEVLSSNAAYFYRRMKDEETLCIDSETGECQVISAGVADFVLCVLFVPAKEKTGAETCTR